MHESTKKYRPRFDSGKMVLITMLLTMLLSSLVVAPASADKEKNTGACTHSLTKPTVRSGGPGQSSRVYYGFYLNCARRYDLAETEFSLQTYVNGRWKNLETVDTSLVALNWDGNRRFADTVAYPRHRTKYRTCVDYYSAANNMIGELVDLVHEHGGCSGSVTIGR